MHGWTGRILHVDLASRRIGELSTEAYAGPYLGGRGIASRIYWERVPPGIGAFDPANRLIFMTGPLVGVGVPAANRLSLVGKSPMAYPEGYCYGNIGGYFGAELKRAGFDGLVVAGRAAGPVYLWIRDGAAELRDASSLWGRGAYRTGELLRETHGDRTRFITIGVAGERLVRSAIILGSHDSTSMAGFGAVMGAKNLKAVAVRGTGRPTAADPARLRELCRYTLAIARRVRLAIPRMVEVTGRGDLLEVIGRGNCYQCPFECIRGQYRYAQKLEGFRRCQSMEFYLPWRYGREDEPVDTWFDSTRLANDWGVDTFELQNIIDWLWACHREGVLTEGETGLPLSQIGGREFLQRLLRMIACREGLGDVLAEGLVRAARQLPEAARARYPYDVAAVGRQDLAPARAIVAHAIIYPMEPRIHQPIIHEISFVRAAWLINQAQPGASPVTGRVLHGIARAFWGSEEAGDLDSYAGKALAAKLIQNRTYVKDSLALCDFGWPITYSFNTADHVGDPDLEARLFAAVTGRAGAAIEPCAERIFNLQRLILLREGRSVPRDDYPPEYNFTVPLGGQGGMPVMTPGPDGKPVPLTGRTLDRERFAGLLKEYYRLRGWDEETGLPRAQTLAALGMADMGRAGIA